MNEPNEKKNGSSALKKYVLLLLRIGIAAAGVGYIVFTLTWQDQVIIAKGTPVPDGRLLVEDTAFDVIKGKIYLAKESTDVTLRISEKNGDAITMEVTAAELARRETFRPSPGVISMITGAKISYLAIGFALIAIGFPVQVFRWGTLMKARGLEAPPWKTFRLIMVGAFFNLCMPGLTGGDVIKAYYAAARSGRRADAVVSVIVDRIVGLVALIILAGTAGLVMFHDDVARGVTLVIWSGLGFGAIGCLVYFSQRLRKYTGLSWILDHLPAKGLLKKVDDAAIAYRNHKAALLTALVVTFPIHIAAVSATALAGYALGMKVQYGLLMTVVPVLILGGAVPLTYQGLGVMEWIGERMLVNPPEVHFNQIVGMLLFFRLYQIGYALLGSLFLLKGDIHLHPEMDDEPETPEAPDDTPAQSDESVEAND